MEGLSKGQIHVHILLLLQLLLSQCILEELLVTDCHKLKYLRQLLWHL
jgi:hypothetical protein